MRGSPLLRVLLVVIALLAVLRPLCSLTTHRAESPPAPASSVAVAESNVNLVLTSTSFPFTFEISHLGKTIWKGEASESSVARDVKMTFPPEGIDLLVDAKWQDNKQGAVKLDVMVDNGDAMTKTLWGTGSVNGVLTFTKPAR
jgi:hypothetical protein